MYTLVGARLRSSFAFTQLYSYDFVDTDEITDDLILSKFAIMYVSVVLVLLEKFWHLSVQSKRTGAV